MASCRKAFRTSAPNIRFEGFTWLWVFPIGRRGTTQRADLVPSPSLRPSPKRWFPEIALKETGNKLGVSKKLEPLQ